MSGLLTVMVLLMIFIRWMLFTTPGNLDQANGVATLTLTAFPIPPATGNAVDEMILSIQDLPTANAGPDAETCEGNSFIVSGASASNYSSLQWTENGQGSLSGTTTLTPTYTPANGETGQVTLTLTAQGIGNCSPDISTMQLVVLSGTTANAGSDGVTCASFSYTVDDASATNYSSLLWTENGSGYLLNSSTLIANLCAWKRGNGISNTNINSQRTRTCGDSQSSMQIEIFPAPTAYAGSDNNTCSNTPFTVTGATATNGSSLLWTENGTGTLSNATTLSPTYTPGNGEVGDVTLTLTVQGQGTCNDAVSNFTLEIVSGPTAYAGENAETCQGSSYTVNDAAATNYNSILWTENGTGYLTNATSLTPTYIPGNGETGNITLTLTVEGIGNCTDAVSSKQLVIFSSPIANAGSNAMSCAGSSYTVNGASAANYSSISWTEDGDGYLTNATSLSPTYHPGANETGIVHLTLTAEGQGSCSDAVSVKQLEIIAGVTADAGADAITCQNNSYTISDATASNYSSILWTSNGLGSIDNATTLSPTYVPAVNETGDITLILTAQSEGGGMCGSAGSTMILEIIPTPTAYAGEDDTSCQNEAYTISGASASSGGTILWTTNGNGTLENQNTLTPTYYPTNNELGNITFTLSVSSANGGFCGEAISIMELEIIPGATANAGPDATICEASSYTVTDATASENSTMLWTTNGNGSISNPTSLSPTYYPATGETGIITLTLTVTSGNGGACGTAQSSLDIEIIPLPFADAGNNEVTCQNESFTINSATSSGNSTVLWTHNGTGTLSNAATLTPTYNPGANEIGNVTLTLTVISGNGGLCGTANSSMLLEILPGAFADAGPDTEICEDNSYTVNGASASDNSTILWTTSGQGVLTNENTLTPTYTPAINEIGEVLLTLSVESGAGGLCGIATSSMDISIIPSAYANAGDNMISCQGESILISGASASQNSTILWTTNGYGMLIDETTINPTYIPGVNEIGEIQFTLTVTSENNGMCGIESSTMTVDIVPGATAFAGIDGTTCQENTYTVTDATASENSSILWTTNGIGILTDETTIMPSYTPATDEVGEIILTMTVQSGGGSCGTATSSKTVLIYPEAYADAGPDDESCQGEIYYLTDAIASEYSSILWTTNGNGLLSDETTLNPSYTPDIEETGEIMFTLTVSSGVNGECGTASSTRILNIVPGATAYAGPNGGMCEGISYTISGASASNYSSLYWTTSGIGTLSGGTTLTPTYTPGVNEIGDVIMTLFVSSNAGGDCGEASSSMTLTIYGEPEAYAGEDQIICESYLLQLDGYAINYSSVVWSTNGDGAFDDPNITNPIYYPGYNDINVGSVDLILTANSLSCNSTSDEVHVQISAMAYANAGPDANICDDETYKLEGSIENTATFIWTSNGDGSFDNPTLIDPVYTPGPNDIFYGLVNLSLTGFSAAPCTVEYTDFMVLTIETCTSVPAYEEQVSFNIMPNPANEYVKFTIDHLQNELVEIYLINMVGEIVKKEQFKTYHGSANGRFTLVGLDQGVYFMQIRSKDYNNSVRLIKLK